LISTFLLYEGIHSSIMVQSKQDRQIRLRSHMSEGAETYLY